MQVALRPIGHDWHGARTERPQWSPFRRGYQQGGGERDTPWSTTLHDLNLELRELQAQDVVVQLDLTEGQIRKYGRSTDGLPREDTKPTTPGVIISFTSKHGPLRYQCDSFHRWQANVRAIALGLESLRRVDRYGITQRGEQYLGWLALPENTLSQREAETFIRTHGVTPDGVTPSRLDQAYRFAAKKLHPDLGGSREDFETLQRAKVVLGL